MIMNHDRYYDDHSFISSSKDIKIQRDKMCHVEMGPSIYKYVPLSLARASTS
jgi:hypothetical protein